MTQENVEKICDVIKDFEKDYDFEDYVVSNDFKDDLKMCDSVNDVMSLLEAMNEDGKMTNTEIIYYASAMNFLRENDPSLRESLEIAYDMGYTADKLNSEMLASMLATRMNEEDWSEFIDNIKDSLEEMEDLFYDEG